MAQTTVFTAGTSVVPNLKRHGVDASDLAVTGRLTRQFLDGLGKDADELSAEIGTMAALRASAGDTVVLLTTDTEAGRRAADLVARIARLRFGVAAEVDPVPGLGLDDGDVFRTRGLPALVERLDGWIAAARNRGDRATVSIGSGINPVIPYVSVYAMLRRVPLVYRFQQTQRLVSLPPLPLGFDHDTLRQAGRMLVDIEREAVLPRHVVTRWFGDTFAALEGLFEPVGDDSLTLSAFGLLLLADVRQASETQVMLSPSAKRTFDAATGIAAEQYAFMLSRVRNPMWRAQKRHTYHTSDLEVYKPGRTSYRLAGWVAGPRLVCVAELLTHADYDARLGERRIRDYDPATFVPWTPPPGEDEIALDTSGDEELAFQRLAERSEVLQGELERVRGAQRVAAERAESDIATAMTAAAAIEERLVAERAAHAERLAVEQAAHEAALADAREELAATRDGLVEARAAADRFASMGLLARLRWAIRRR